MASSGFALSLPLKSGCHMSCVIMPHAASIATRPCFSSASRYLQGAASCEHLPCAHRSAHVHVRTHASAPGSVPNSALHPPSCSTLPPPGFKSAGHFFIVSGLASLEKPSGSKYARGAQSPIRPPTFICTATLLDAGRSTTLFGAKDATLRANGADVRRRNRLLQLLFEL